MTFKDRRISHWSCTLCRGHTGTRRTSTEDAGKHNVHSRSGRGQYHVSALHWRTVPCIVRHQWQPTYPAPSRPPAGLSTFGRCVQQSFLRFSQSTSETPELATCISLPCLNMNYPAASILERSCFPNSSRQTRSPICLWDTTGSLTIGHLFETANRGESRHHGAVAQHNIPL